MADAEPIGQILRQPMQEIVAGVAPGHDQMAREGDFREMKLRSNYGKPSERRVREKAEAIRRARKLARKKLQREGLLPMKGPSQGWLELKVA